MSAVSAPPSSGASARQGFNRTLPMTSVPPPAASSGPIPSPRPTYPSYQQTATPQAMPTPISTPQPPSGAPWAIIVAIVAVVAIAGTAAAALLLR